MPLTVAETALKMVFLLALIGFTTATRSFISSSAALHLTVDIGTVALLLLLRLPRGVMSVACVRKQAGRIPSDTSITYLPGGVSRGRMMFSTSPYPPCNVTTTSLTAVQSNGTEQLPESALPAVQVALLSQSIRLSLCGHSALATLDLVFFLASWALQAA
jgi:hypothetical protein